MTTTDYGDKGGYLVMDLELLAKRVGGEFVYTGGNIYNVVIQLDGDVELRITENWDSETTVNCWYYMGEDYDMERSLMDADEQQVIEWVMVRGGLTL
jgi:hypothetical protein